MVYTIQEYEPFEGDITEAMAHCNAHQRRFPTIEEVMKRRLEVVNESPDIRDFWWNNDFFTRDSLVYQPTGNFKVKTNSSNLDGATIDTLFLGGTKSSEEEYRLLGGEYLIQNFSVEPHSVEKISTNPLWSELVEDKLLLSYYAQAVAHMCGESKVMPFEFDLEVVPNSDTNFILENLGPEDWELYGELKEVADMESKGEMPEKSYFVEKNIRLGGVLDLSSANTEAHIGTEQSFVLAKDYRM